MGDAMSKRRYLQAVKDYHYIVEIYGDAVDTADSGYTAAFWLVFGHMGRELTFESAAQVVRDHISQIFSHGYQTDYTDTGTDLPVDRDKRLQRIKQRWDIP